METPFLQQRPRMRPVEAFAVRQGGETHIGLRDRSGLVSEILLTTPPVLFVISQLDGETPLGTVAHRFAEKYGVLLSEEDLRDILDSLDAYLFLDSRHFAQWLAEEKRKFSALPARPAVCAGSGYPAEREKLTESLARILSSDGATSLKRRRPRGLIVPHIDYRRGAPCYAAGYGALSAAGPADTYVILGTNHFGGDRYYTATRLPFDTPLGRAEIDSRRLARIAAAYGDDLFNDEFDHAREHSVELAVVFLLHLFGSEKFRIVPILCGGFEMLGHRDLSPEQVDSVQTMVGVLRELVEEAPGRVCLVAAADLSHFGRHFGDEAPLSPDWTRQVEQNDRAILAEAEAGRPADFFDRLYADGNRSRICSAANLYTLLSALGRPGQLLHYHQALDEENQCAVTCAAMWFA